MLRAFIDESGDRGHGGGATPHFVMSAVIFRSAHDDLVPHLLAAMRQQTGRQPGHMLSFKKMRADQKLAAATRIGRARWLKTVSVVVCKDHLLDTLPTPDLRYMYTFRLLLERLSWLAGRRREPAEYTLAHILRFKAETLATYEAKLREMDTAINWKWLDPTGGKVDQPSRIEALQLADTAASAVGAAFNPHQNTGRVTLDYFMAMRDSAWCPEGGNLTSYGLKMHPWADSTRAAYPWVAAL